MLVRRKSAVATEILRVWVSGFSLGFGWVHAGLRVRQLAAVTACSIFTINLWTILVSVLVGHTQSLESAWSPRAEYDLRAPMFLELIGYSAYAAYLVAVSTHTVRKCVEVYELLHHPQNLTRSDAARRI